MQKFNLFKAVLMSCFVISLFSLSSSLNAQIFFSEDFETITPPALPPGWTSTTLDSSPLAGFQTASNVLAPLWGVPMHTNFAVADDNTTNFNSSADYLILPPQDLSSYSQVYLFAEVYHDNGFFTNLALIEVSTDAGATWAVVDTLDNNNNWAPIQVDLSAYSGSGFSNVLIAFRYNDLGQWTTGFAVDDVYLSNPTTTEDIKAISAGEYTQIPAAHIPAMANAKAANTSSVDVNNVVLTVDLLNSTTNALITSISSNPATIPAGDTVDFAVNFPATTEGDYILNYSFNFGTTDLFPLNDTISYNFSYTPATYARDNGIVFDGLGIDAPGIIVQGHAFELLTSDVLEALQVRYSGGAMGDTISIQVYSTVNGSPDTIISESTPTVLTNSGTGPGSITLEFDSLVTLPQGTYVVALRHVCTGTNIGLSFSNSITTPGTSWIQINNQAWTTPENFGFNLAYIIRAVFQTCNIVGSVSITDADCGIDNGTAFAIPPTGGSMPYTFSWPNGETTQTISSLAPGVYVLTITDASGCAQTISATINELPGPMLSAIDNMNGSATVSISGGTAPFTYLWSDTNAQTSETATNLSPGTYNVTVTDDNGCSASTQVTVGPNSLNTLTNLHRIQLYPNPANQTVKVITNLLTRGPIEVAVVDMTGKVISYNSYNTFRQIELNVNNLANGFYMVELRTNDQTVTKRLSIQH